MKKIMFLLCLALVLTVAVATEINDQRPKGDGIKEPTPIGTTIHTSDVAFYEGKKLKKG